MGAMAMTVLGPVPVDRLGRVMPHEHLFSLVPGPWMTGGEPDDVVGRAVDALGALTRLGFGTVVDLSPYGVVGRTGDGGNVELLREVSRRSGIHVIAGTALYLESYAPEWARDADVSTLTERFIADATGGIGGTDVRAGVFGEQATSLGVITPYEERVLRAIARASGETGLAIMTHTTHGTMALDQMRILELEGADLDRVVIGHMDTQLSVDLAVEVIDRGARIAIDTIGKQVWNFFLEPPPERRPDGEFLTRSFARSDQGRAEMVARLVERGYADRILLAQDLTGAEVWMNPDTHGNLGYSYLGDVFLPLLRTLGVGDEAIDTMTVHTPAQILSVAS